MPAHVVQNSLFMIQSSVLVGVLVLVTISTKPSDVYRKVDELEQNVMNRLQQNAELFSRADTDISSIKVWNKETVQQLIRIQGQIDRNSKWIEDRTRDRWTSEDQKAWEKAKFGEVLGATDAVD